MAQYLRDINQIRNAIDSGSLSDAEVSAIIKNGAPVFRSIWELLSHSETVKEFQSNYREVVSIFSHIFGANFPAVVHEKEDLEFWTEDEKWKELTRLARRSRRRVTQSQQIGLFHKFGLRRKYPDSADAHRIIGVGGSTLRQFDSAKKKFDRNGQSVSTALSYLCDGTWDITKFRNASEALEKAKSLQRELKKVGVDVTLNENIPLLAAVNCEVYLPDLEEAIKDLDEEAIDRLREIESFPESFAARAQVGGIFSRIVAARAQVGGTDNKILSRGSML